MIRLQTCKGYNLPNHQGTDISAFNRNWARDIPTRHQDVEVRTGLNPLYKCFGMVFASRRTNIPSGNAIQRILKDDGYVRIEQDEALPGDIILYFREGTSPTHAGVVIENEADPVSVPVVISKWGSGPEIIHKQHDVPKVYGHNYRYYRCQPLI